MKKDLYSTKDLAETAALIVKKQILIDIVRESSICWFKFKDKEECQKISNNFFFGELQVNAREYHEALSRLKNRIFSTR